MDGTKIFDKLTQFSNLEYEIFGKDNHKYNIITMIWNTITYLSTKL